ncbi:MAG: tetratricopeptide repeat protein [Deltaproteobacteria bacterium]|nr:MAG: tetratricopeptide repeat protein [Deltaproteobacteria bacterium]
MNRYQRELFYKQSAKQDFLLSKTDVRPEDGKSKSTVSNDVKNALLKTFPGFLCAQSFMERALSNLDTAVTFGAMVIQIDNSISRDRGTRKLNSVARHTQVAKTIDRICQSENSLWGLVECDLFGCFFAEKDAAFCRKLGQRLKQNLTKQRTATVSIGIAAYPTIHFKKDQIFENARKALDHAAFFGPDSLVVFDAVSLNISGDKLYDKGNIKDAANEFKTALLLDPSNVNIRNSLGVCYGVMDELDKALSEFKKAINLNPKEVMSVYNAGLVNMLKGEKNKALEYLLDAIRLDKESFEISFQTGRVYLDLKKPENAKNYLEKATRLRPDSGPAFTSLGECYAAMGLKDKAVAALKKAVKQNSDNAAALSALGWLFASLGENLEIATIFCQQSVDIAPDNGLFRHRLGRLYLKENQLEDALTQFKEATKLGYDSSRYIAQIEEKHISKAS